MNTNIPFWYSYHLHLLFPPLIGFIIILCCLFLLSNIFWYELLFGLIFFIIMIFIEWFIHKNILHKKFIFLTYLLKMHSIHHTMFKYDSMEIKNYNELYHVLVPIYAIGLVFLGLLPFALVASLISINLGLITMISGVLFFLLYEVLHLSYHMPRASWLNRVSRRLGLERTHRLHHKMENMKKYNFNVTFPLADKMLGTYK